MRVRLVKRRKPPLEYDAEVLSDDGVQIVLRAEHGGGVWREHYWADRCYAVKEVYDAGGVLAGWYCDVARPATWDADQLVSEDLDLDLWVSADRATIQRLDEDETEWTPEVTAAIEELERLARAGHPPFKDQRLVFGEDAELYDRMRPSYPSPLIDDLVALVGAGARALDVGCGTGKATELLAARGLTGVGVDADPNMAALARRRLRPYPGWRVDVAPFEGWAPAADDAPFDLVTCGEAWHWFDAKLGLRQAHAQLRASGALALFWNRQGQDDSPLRLAIDRAHGELAPNIDGLARHFRQLPHGAQRTYSWIQRYSADEWVALARTHAGYVTLSPDRLEPLLAAVHAAIEAHGGVYRHIYETVLWLGRREDLLPGQ